MRYYMVDPDNEERLLKVPPHVVKRIKAEAYAEAVEALKALTLPPLLHPHYQYGTQDAVAAIEELNES